MPNNSLIKDHRLCYWSAATGSTLPSDAQSHLENIIIACGCKLLEGKWTAQVAANSHIPPIDPVTGRPITVGVRKDVYIVSLSSLSDVLLVNRSDSKVMAADGHIKAMLDSFKFLKQRTAVQLEGSTYIHCNIHIHLSRATLLPSSSFAGFVISFSHITDVTTSAVSNTNNDVQNNHSNSDGGSSQQLQTVDSIYEAISDIVGGLGGALTQVKPSYEGYKLLEKCSEYHVAVDYVQLMQEFLK